MQWLVVCLFLFHGASVLAAEEELEHYTSERANTSVPTALIELDGSGSEDPEGGELTYLWTQLDGPKVELSDPASPKPYFRTGRQGLYRFQLVVTANGLESDPFIVEIMIERDNQPPIAVAPVEMTGAVGRPVEIDGTGSYDPEEVQLTYRWRSLTQGLDIPPDMASQPKLTFTPPNPGVFLLELVVSDGEMVSQPFITTLTVRPPPKPPIAVAVAIPREIPSMDQYEQVAGPPPGAPPTARIEGPVVAQLGERVTLNGQGSRAAEGAKLEYLWRQKSGPFINDFELLFDGAAERFQPFQPGDYEFELIVSDGTRESAPVVHQLKVTKEAEPPVAVVVAPGRAMPGALVKLDATQSYDLEGSALQYRWRQTGGPRVTRYVIDESLGEAAPAFHPPSSGVYSFELIVSNGKMQSRPIEIDIEVGDARRPPTLSITGPEVANTGSRVVLNAVAERVGERLLTFVWRQVEGPATALPTTSGSWASVAAPLPGRYVFDLSALENGQVVATTRKTLEVFSPPPGRGQAQPDPGVPELGPPAMAPTPSILAARADPDTVSQGQPSPIPSMAAVPVNPATPVPSLPATTVPSGRPAAQIHPSSLGPVNFLDPVNPVGSLPPLVP